MKAPIIATALAMFAIMYGSAPAMANSSALAKIKSDILLLAEKREQYVYEKFNSYCMEECKDSTAGNCANNCVADSSFSDPEWVKMSAQIQDLYRSKKEEEKKAEEKLSAEVQAIQKQMKQVSEKYEDGCKSVCSKELDESCVEDCIFESCNNDKEWKSLVKLRTKIVSEESHQTKEDK